MVSVMYVNIARDVLGNNAQSNLHVIFLMSHLALLYLTLCNVLNLHSLTHGSDCHGKNEYFKAKFSIKNREGKLSEKQ